MNSEEENKDRYNERSRSHSSSIISTIRDQSSPRYRSRSPLSSRHVKEEVNYNKNKSLSRMDHLDRPSRSDNYVNYFPPYFNYIYNRSPKLMSTFRAQQSTTIWPIEPIPFLTPFPMIPPNMIRWRLPPPRLTNYNIAGRSNWNRR